MERDARVFERKINRRFNSSIERLREKFEDLSLYDLEEAKGQKVNESRVSGLLEERGLLQDSNRIASQALDSGNEILKGLQSSSNMLEVGKNFLFFSNF